jgi:GNAT superfamily N-acetyltransferase
VAKPITFSIRRATHGDAPGILQCLHSAFEAYRQNYTPQAFDDTVLTIDTLYERMNTMTLFVAETPALEIIGTIGCNVITTAEGHIRGMAVQPRWQGCGVAERLLRSCESELSDRMCIRISLDTTEPLHKAIRFYEKNGYSASGKVEDFFGMQLFEYTKQIKN